MDQVVIPNLRRLNLVFPDAVFELHEQMKAQDSLSFQAIGNKDVLFQVTVKKTAGLSTQLNIETIDENAGVLELERDEWHCHLKGITSEAFLLPGHVTNNTTPEDEKDGITSIMSPSTVAITSPIASPNSQDIPSLMPNDEDEHITVIAPIANLDDTLQQELTNGPVSTSNELANLVNPLLKTEMPEEDPLPPENVIIGENVSSKEVDAGEADEFTAEAAEPDENANEGVLNERKYKQEETEESNSLMEEETPEGVALIFLGKKKKVTVKTGNTSEIVREAVETTCDKMVQSEAKELETIDNASEDLGEVASEGFDLDLSLNETASISDQATNILKKLMERGENKLIDPNSVVENFPIIREDGKYKCHICNMLLLKRHYLVSHMRYVHKVCVRDPLALMQCPYCPATFARKNRYNEHLIHKHTEHKPYICDMVDCNMAFKTIYNLRDHKRIFHYHMLRYACDICKKSYENPNTVVRHRKACFKQYRLIHPEIGDVSEKTSEELRNPDWIPINDLFHTSPKARPKKQKKSIKIKDAKDHRESDAKENIHLEEGEIPQEELELIQAAEQEYWRSENSNITEENGQQDIENLESDNAEGSAQIESSAGSSAKHHSSTDEGLKVVNVTIIQDNKNNILGKRKVTELDNVESPAKKKLKNDVKNLKIISEGEDPMYTTVKLPTISPAIKIIDRKSSQLAGREKTDYKRNSDTNIEKLENITSKGSEEDSSYKGNSVKSSPKRKTEENFGRNLKDKGDHLGDATGDKIVQKLSFKAQGILHTSKVYTIDHEELCRRMYGPETVNTVTFMSFIKKEEGCSKIAEFKKKLINGGYLVPRFTSITSSFSKLSEGEVTDLITDFKELQSEYFAEDKLVATFLCEISNTYEEKELEYYLKMARTFLEHIKTNVDNHMVDFGEVTHTFGPEVIVHLLDLYCNMMMSSHEKAMSGHLNTSREEKLEKKKRLRGIPCKRKKGSFSVPGILPVTSTEYEVSIEEIERRAELPEQMGVTLLHSYLRRGKSTLNTVIDECSQMGLILQKGNRTWIQSGFSRLIEAEAQKLCEDFDKLLKNHFTMKKLVLDVVQCIAVSTDKGELTKILESIRTWEKELSLDKRVSDNREMDDEVLLMVSPCMETTIDIQCEDFNLVTHTVGKHIATATWTFVNNVAKECSDYCS